jgi:protein required for attachment to host cells
MHGTGGKGAIETARSRTEELIMAKLGIITADGARARFITAEVVPDPDLEGNPRLTEQANLVHPLRDVPAREEFSDRPSRKPSGAGPRGAGPVTDDHRDRHAAEDERRFARDLVLAGLRFVAEHGLTRVVLAATPRLLGVLRDQLGSRALGGVEVLELPLDLSGMSLAQVREALTRRGMLPEPQLPRAGVFRPRGQEPTSR